jgi:hypothetical protein
VLWWQYFSCSTSNCSVVWSRDCYCCIGMQCNTVFTSQCCQGHDNGKWTSLHLKHGQLMLLCRFILFAMLWYYNSQQRNHMHDAGICKSEERTWFQTDVINSQMKSWKGLSNIFFCPTPSFPRAWYYTLPLLSCQVQLVCIASTRFVLCNGYTNFVRIFCFVTKQTF